MFGEPGAALSLIGVNTFLPKGHAGEVATTIELIRSTEEEKAQQIANVEAYRVNRNRIAPELLKALQQAARERKNVFAQLMEAVKFNSEGRLVTRCTMSAENTGETCDPTDALTRAKCLLQ